MSKRYNLIKLRKEAGFNQSDFADKLGFSKTHISDIENDKSNPSFEFIEKLEKFCEEENIVVDDVWELFKKK